ncbi:MAG: SGNH/GDSL hydrolase family protein [Piscinibacter sp.]|uniref:SGNH/GDSL hydrolase family protein n=1 Tax=Piscinibacter sp. TaxID=1903157 RepID=UPI001B72C1F8|nr:SGNH/GDSL hydrolase family protein [Piscinibacter sp.]MBP5991576.1 SGNH/GDSL hydrolase family protein [Piscinibacter sp.]MBP6027146.1 SGNH/GDSL hydrolase family protein [Piscinibacter sp.]
MSLALKLALAPLLVAQAMATRRRAPVLPEAEGAREGRVGEGERLALLIVGDSSAAGVGVATQEEALAGHLTRTLASEAQRRVSWQLVARSGITTAQALELVRQVRPMPAEIAVAVLGVNDVIDQVSAARAVQQRAALADWLRQAAGVRHVVFAPLPPVHRFPLLPQPLRHVMGADARAHDEAVARWAATRDDVSHVPIEWQLGPEHMAPDGFHPGEPVYRAIGEALARFIAQRLITPEAGS